MKKYLIPIIAMLLAISVPSHAKNTPTSSCKNLGKVTDIDDLLYQMHSNIDNQCLFEIPPTKLEEIWGIPVFDFTQYPYTPKQQVFWDTETARLQAIRQEKETLYLSKKVGDGSHQFFIVSSTPKMRLKYPFSGLGGSLSLGQYPKSIPIPNTFKLPTYEQRYINNYVWIPQEIIPKGNVYSGHHYYFWINQKRKKTAPIIETKTLFNPDIGSFYFHNQAKYSRIYHHIIQHK